MRKDHSELLVYGSIMPPIRDNPKKAHKERIWRVSASSFGMEERKELRRKELV